MVDRPILTDKDIFAEHLAEGMTVLQIRGVMSLSEGEASKYMRAIRDDLGVPVRD